MNVPMFNFDVSYTEKAVFQRQNMLAIIGKIAYFVIRNLQI